MEFHTVDNQKHTVAENDLLKAFGIVLENASIQAVSIQGNNLLLVLFSHQHNVSLPVPIPCQAIQDKGLVPHNVRITGVNL